MSPFKIVLLATALFLSACSGTTPTRSCYSDACKLGGNNASLNLRGSASSLGSNFNEYGSGLLHD